MQSETGADDFIEVADFCLHPQVFAKSAKFFAHLKQRRDRFPGSSIIEVFQDTIDLVADSIALRQARPVRVDPAENSAAFRDGCAVEKLEIFLTLAASDFDAETLALVHNPARSGDLWERIGQEVVGSHPLRAEPIL